MSPPALVVGYGNALRGDDGVGWCAAELLSADSRLAGVTVLQRQQLTPELALDVSAAAVVVFVDASSTKPAGRVTVSRVGSTGAGGTTWSHRLGPATLVALADELYGRSPDAFLVSCGVASVEAGDTLSPQVEAAVPSIVDAVAALVTEDAGA